VTKLSEFLGVPEEDVLRLRLGVDDDLPESAEENSLRLRMLERAQQEDHEEILYLRSEIATLKDMLTRWFTNNGPPGPEGRQLRPPRELPPPEK
jgi:hypothetical protein